MDLRSEVRDGVAIIYVAGEVDGSNAHELRDLSLEALSNGASSLVLDCAELTFIDSAGLGALITAYKAADVQWGTVTIRNPSPFAERLIGITGLTAVLNIEHGE